MRYGERTRVGGDEAATGQNFSLKAANPSKTPQNSKSFPFPDHSGIFPDDGAKVPHWHSSHQAPATRRGRCRFGSDLTGKLIKSPRGRRRARLCRAKAGGAPEVGALWVGVGGRKKRYLIRHVPGLIPLSSPGRGTAKFDLPHRQRCLSLKRKGGQDNV
jgi:hypothetical protein